MGHDHATAAGRARHAKPARLHRGDVVDARLVEAEQRTSDALDALDPDVWTVIKDLEWPGGRYGHVDHVVVGPSGVYVVDTKTWSGDVSVYGDRLRHEGYRQDSEVASMTEAAAAVALLTPGVPQQRVKPVICVSGGEALDTHVSGMLVCSTDTLVPMLEARVHAMSTHQIAIASGQLRDHLHDRGLVRVAARAGHSEVKKKEFVPMRGVPVIRIAIACWFASTVVLAPHVFVDTYETINDQVDRVQLEIDRR